MSIKTVEATKASKATKEINFLGQTPYCELPFHMDSINNIKTYNSLVIVFEGLEGNSKKYKYIRINYADKIKDKTADWDYRYWPADIMLKKVLFLIYLGVWANMESLIEKLKIQLDKKEKIEDYSFESIMKGKNLEYYNELKIILEKLVENKITRIYIVHISIAEKELTIIKENLGSKGFTEWELNDLKNKDEDITIIATKYFTLDNLKSLREEGLLYIKMFETRYNKEKKDKKDKKEKKEVK
jgi:hypothetical protein